MKSPQQQRIERVQKILELITQAAENTAKAFDETLPLSKRGEHALKGIMIQEVELPLVMQTPIQVKEYEKGGSFPESGREMVINPDGSMFWPICDAYKVKPTLLSTKDCAITFAPIDNGKMDIHGDVIMPGAFDKSITEYTPDPEKADWDWYKRQK